MKHDLNKVINAKREHQRWQILDHMMKKGSITSDEGLTSFGCRRTAARICELRKMGFVIKTVMVGTGQKYARYFLDRKSSEMEMQA